MEQSQSDGVRPDTDAESDRIYVLRADSDAAEYLRRAIDREWQKQFGDG